MPSWHDAFRHRRSRSANCTVPADCTVPGDDRGAVDVPTLRHRVARSMLASVVGLAAAGSVLGADRATIGNPAAGAGEPVAAEAQTLEAKPTEQSVDRSVTAALLEHAEQAEAEVSRSALRPTTVAAQRATKAAALSTSEQTLRSGVTATVSPSDPRAIAASMLASFGWSSDQFFCLNQLWVSESDWNPYAVNSTSGAYGIPQALPAEKMASAGSDWRTNPITQIEWGLDYIRLSYGTPCGAWAFKLSNSWY